MFIRNNRAPEASKTVTSPARSTSLLHRRDEDSHAAHTSILMEDYGILSRELFARMLFVERKRTERSGRSFVLMLLESTKLLKPEGDHRALEKVLLALSRSTRDTDTKGWYKQESTIGVIFTELGADADGRVVADALLTKVTKALTGSLTIGQINQIRLSFHVFPEDWDQSSPVDETESVLYDDLLHETAPKSLPRLAKRAMDVAGSLLALLFGMPLFLAVAIVIKLTSKGPVLFCQQRLGQYGRRFNFLKFRSMCVNNDATIHREYVKRFIADQNLSSQAAEGQAPYKLTADPRVTSIGRFLRKT